jgi:hypothetical protein
MEHGLFSAARLFYFYVSLSPVSMVVVQHRPRYLKAESYFIGMGWHRVIRLNMQSRKSDARWKMHAAGAIRTYLNEEFYFRFQFDCMCDNSV